MRSIYSVYPRDEVYLLLFTHGLRSLLLRLTHGLWSLLLRLTHGMRTVHHLGIYRDEDCTPPGYIPGWGVFSSLWPRDKVSSPRYDRGMLYVHHVVPGMLHVHHVVPGMRCLLLVSLTRDEVSSPRY